VQSNQRNLDADLRHIETSWKNQRKTRQAYCTLAGRRAPTSTTAATNRREKRIPSFGRGDQGLGRQTTTGVAKHHQRFRDGPKAANTLSGTTPILESWTGLYSVDSGTPELSAAEKSITFDAIA
jgi:hypothetical protein